MAENRRKVGERNVGREEGMAGNKDESHIYDYNLAVSTSDYNLTVSKSDSIVMHDPGTGPSDRIVVDECLRTEKQIT